MNRRNESALAAVLAAFLLTTLAAACTPDVG